jgi:hypothetical protein
MKKLAVALLIVAIGRLASPAAVPVYDGIGNPDQPYKYAGRSGAPAPATTTVPVSAGASGPLEVRSSEMGPQLLVQLAAGAFQAPTHTLTVTATPMQGDGTTVPEGTIDGNVYRFTATPGAVLRPDRALGFLFLRAAVMTRPNPVVVHRSSDSGPWEKVKTVRAGTDILSTPFKALGDYAVVRPPGAKPLSQGGGLSGLRLALLAGGVVVLVGITVLVLRRSRPEPES